MTVIRSRKNTDHKRAARTMRLACQSIDLLTELVRSHQVSHGILAAVILLACAFSSTRSLAGEKQRLAAVTTSRPEKLIPVDLTADYSIPPKLYPRPADVPSRGATQADFHALDEFFQKFLHTHNVAGASVAIAKNGRLLYARAFGYRDLSRRAAVEISTQFRIASLSKPITALTLLTLQHSERLDLDDQLMQHLPQPQQSMLHADLHGARLRDLLQHRGGWDRDRSGDPMFSVTKVTDKLHLSRPVTQQELINYYLKQTLDFSPGKQYAYSNYGYCLLGQVIQHVSGRSYHDCVQQELFKPLNILSTKLGRTQFRAANETYYYTRKTRTASSVMRDNWRKTVPTQYGGWNLEFMDAHGGWISTATDLVRLASAFDQHPLLKQPQVVNAVVAAHPQEDRTPVWYGLGWQVRKVRDQKYNLWHTGGLTGTSTILVRRHDGFVWAILFNTRRSQNGKSLAPLIDSAMHRQVNSVARWTAGRRLFE